MPAKPTTTATLELNAVDNTSSVVNRVSSAVKGLTKDYTALTGAITGLGGAYSLGAIAGMIRDTIALEASVGRLAERAGTSAEALSSLIEVAKMSHTDLETVATGMAKLSKAMVEAESGTGKAGKVFEALGIELRDSSGQMRGAQDVMQDLGKALFAMKDQTLAVAFAQEVLGKNGAALLPFLYELARAGELHAKFTNEEAKAAKELEDNLIRLEAASGKLKISIANALVPALISITENLVNAKSAGDKFLQFTVEFAKVSMIALGLPAPVIQAVFDADERSRRQTTSGKIRYPAPQPGTVDVKNPFAAATGGDPALGWTPQQEEMFQARKRAWLESEKMTDDAAAAVGREADAAAKLSDQQDKEAKHYLDILDPARAYLETQEKLYALLAAGKLTLDETLAIQRKVFEAKNGIKDLAETTGVAADAGHAMGLSFTSALERVIFDSGRAVNAMDLLKAAAMDVAKVIYGRNVAEPIAGVVQGGISSLLAGFGSNNAYVSGTMTAESAGMLGQAFHSGGMVGIDGVGRYIHPAYFENAPRFHDGLMPDEFPAILQQGEGVFTQAQMKAMGGSGDVYNIDARGADRAGMARLEARIAALGGSMSHVALEAMRRDGYRKGRATR
jgi:hypothetical protein